jgi:hypothetical protein
VIKSSLLKALAARISAGTARAEGGYVFDLRGQWRYESGTRARAGAEAARERQRRPRRQNYGVTPFGCEVTEATGTCR